MAEVKGYERRQVEQFGDGAVFDYHYTRDFMVSASTPTDGGGCLSFGARPSSIEDAVALRDELMASRPEEVARYSVWEIVELQTIIRHRVVDTRVVGEEESRG